MFKITVPATSANIGPGFDSFGIALTMYNDYYIDFSNETVIEGTKNHEPNNDLVYISAMKLFQKYYGDNNYSINLFIRYDTSIPQSRGLGSSAACIVGGIIGANLLLGEPYTKEELFQIAVSIEGHPDNIAPALFGGFNISFNNNGYYIRKKIEISMDFNYYILIPDFELETKNSRDILPDRIDFKNAVTNTALASLLLVSLISGDAELLKEVSWDTLHQPYRKKLIKDFDMVYDLSIRNGALGCLLSGAGPSLLCITDHKNDFLNIMKNNLKYINTNWIIEKLEVDKYGAIYTHEQR